MLVNIIYKLPQAGRQKGTRVDDDDSFCCEKERERENYASSNNNGVGVGLEHSGG